MQEAKKSKQIRPYDKKIQIRVEINMIGKNETITKA